jgi:hypothetical protein
MFCKDSYLHIPFCTTYNEKNCQDKHIFDGLIMKVHNESERSQMLLVPRSCVAENVVFTQTYDSECDVTMLYFIPQDKMKQEFVYAQTDDDLLFIIYYNYKDKIIAVEILFAIEQLEKYK